MESNNRSANIVITGAGSGIGRATALRLQSRAKTLWLIDIDGEALQSTRSLLNGSHVELIQCDVGDEALCISAFKRIREEISQIDFLILAAGITTEGFLETMSLDDWNLILNSNLTGSFLAIRCAVPLMVGSPAPVIVAIGSVSSHLVGAGGGNVAYEVSKAGLNQLMRAVAFEHARNGIRAVLVSPGRTSTNFGANSRRIQAEIMTSRPILTRKSKVKEIPLQRSATADEIAASVEFLCSRDAGYITGVELVVDGGYGLY